MQLNLPILSENDTSHQAPVSQSLHTIFESISNRLSLSNSEDNKFMKMRKLLGKAAQGLSDEQIEALTINFQYLVDSWIDEYERKVFNGKLLREVLNEEA